MTITIVIIWHPGHLVKCVSPNNCYVAMVIN